MKPRTKLAVASLLLSTLNPQFSTAFAQGTAFTYQGRLNDGGNPAGGIYDLRFTIYDSAGGPTVVGGPLTNTATGVTNGLFVVTLDCGNVFPGASRFLEIAARASGGGAFTTLSPRQPLAPTPYAITAANVPSGGLSAGTYNTAVTFNNSANAFSGSFSGNGGGLTNINAATLGGLSASNFWKLGGNTGTTPGANYLGTTDGQPLQIRAGGVGIGTAAPLAPLQVVSSNNSVPQLLLTQDMTNNFSRLRMNVTGSPFWEMDVGNGATPSLSFWNVFQRMVVDYTGNVFAASFTGGGSGLTGLNAASLSSGTVPDARLSSNVALRAGGNAFTGNQTITSGSVGIGTGSPAATLHVASSSGAPEIQITQNNTADYTRLRMNVSTFPSWEIDVSPGATPLLQFWNNTLRMVLDYSGHLGIGTGSPDSPLHIVSAGFTPQLHLNQTTSGDYAKLHLTVNDGNLWAIGVSDSGSTPGNLEFRTESGAAKMRIDRVGNVYSIMGFNGSSDRNRKENFVPVNPLDVLDKVAAMPITRWNFKEDAGATHLGPMAQDFRAAFGLGTDERHIATVDADGVALAAIQGLNQKLEQKEAEITALKTRLEALERIIRNPKSN